MSEEIILSDRNVPRQSLPDELTRLYSQGFLTDITLSTEDGKNFEAHRILLAARSAYFHSVVPRLKTDPVIFLKGVKGAHLDKILKFMYGSGVAVSKHQLKPILEVAKLLQVKGLQDVTPNDILSRQSLVSASKFKPDSPLASPLLTKVASASHATKSGSATLVDKTTLTSFKTLPSRRTLKSSVLSASNDSGRLAVSSPVNSGSDDEKEKDEPPVTTESSTNVTQPKKRRGRPPKKKDPPPAAKEAIPKEDPYEFEEESNDGGDRFQSSERKKSGHSRVEEDDNDSDDLSSPNNQEEDTRVRSNESRSLRENVDDINLSYFSMDPNTRLTESRFYRLNAR